MPPLEPASWCVVCNGADSFARTGEVDEDGLLRQGYAVAGSTLNVYGNYCDDLVAAETMMMVREHFIETYGAPKGIIGIGGLAKAVVGFLAGFTTYSTWMVETVRLGPISPPAATNLVISLVGGVVLAGLGYIMAM